MYTYNSEVKYSEAEANGYLSYSGLMNFFQDCSTMHVEHTGMPTIRLRDEFHQAWVVSSWQIVFDKVPKLGQKVAASTIPYEFRGGCGLRNFLLSDENGKVLVAANSIWTLIDTNTLGPKRLTDEAMYNIILEDKYDMNYEPRKIKLPKNDLDENGNVTLDKWTKEEVIKVRKCHIDTNNHVNNARYLEMILEYLPEITEIKQLRIQYNQPAVLAEEVVIKTALEEDKKYITLERTSGELFVAFEVCYK